MAVCLSFCERGVIKKLIDSGFSFSRVGFVLGRSVSTVSREVGCNGGRDGYDPLIADKRAARLRKRPKVFKFVEFPRLAELVFYLLSVRKMSPHTIAVWMRKKRLKLRVCAETIYQACYRSYTNMDKRQKRVQRCQSGMPDDLCDYLPRTRKRRKKRSTPKRVHHLGAGFKHVTDRKHVNWFGHWEGDLIAGAGNRSFVITLIETKSKYTILWVIDSKKSSEFVERMCEIADRYPDVFKSITWDQGLEARRWRQCEKLTGIPFYFASPRSPWQRPLNEQNNSVIRKWLPKGTNINRTQKELNKISAELNSHPRKSLNGKTPEKVYNQYSKQCVHQ